MTAIRNLGAYIGGVDDSGDHGSWPVAGKLHVYANGGPNNKPWARFLGDTATYQPGQPENLRIHCRGFGDGGANPEPAFQPGAVNWRCLSIRVPGAQNTASDTAIWAGDEMHQSSDYGTTGPAPSNSPTHDGIGNRWYNLIRGANNRGLAGDTFYQTTFGRASSNNGPLYQYNGGARLVVADRWTYWIIGIKYDYQANGWYEVWYRDDTLSDWVNVVPRRTGLYTCYNNGNYPMLSLYSSMNMSGGQTKAIDYACGFYVLGDDFATALAESNLRNGFSSGGGGSSTHPSTGALGTIGSPITTFGGVALGTIRSGTTFGTGTKGSARSTVTYPPA